MELSADLGVTAVAPRKEHGLWAELTGAHRGHGGTHPEDPRFVGARRHHTSGAGTADDDREAGQSGVVEHFDRREERVHVHVQDAGGAGVPLSSRTERQPAEALGKGHPGAAALFLGPAPDGLAGPAAGLGELGAMTLDGGRLALDGL